MSSLMSLKMSTLTGLDAVIKDGQLSSRDRSTSAISQNGSLKRTFLSNKAQVTVAPYKVVTSSQDLADMDLSKTMSSRLRQVAMMGMDKRSFARKQTWKKPMR